MADGVGGCLDAADEGLALRGGDVFREKLDAEARVIRAVERSADMCLAVARDDGPEHGGVLEMVGSVVAVAPIVGGRAVAAEVDANAAVGEDGIVRDRVIVSGEDGDAAAGVVRNGIADNARCLTAGDLDAGAAVAGDDISEHGIEPADDDAIGAGKQDSPRGIGLDEVAGEARPSGEAIEPVADDRDAVTAAARNVVTRTNAADGIDADDVIRGMVAFDADAIAEIPKSIASGNNGLRTRADGICTDDVCGEVGSGSARVDEDAVARIARDVVAVASQIVADKVARSADKDAVAVVEGNVIRENAVAVAFDGDATFAVRGNGVHAGGSTAGICEEEAKPGIAQRDRAAGIGADGVAKNGVSTRGLAQLDTIGTVAGNDIAAWPGKSPDSYSDGMGEIDAGLLVRKRGKAGKVSSNEVTQDAQVTLTGGAAIDLDSIPEIAGNEIARTNAIAANDHRRNAENADARTAIPARRCPLCIGADEIAGEGSVALKYFF